MPATELRSLPACLLLRRTGVRERDQIIERDRPRRHMDDADARRDVDFLRYRGEDEVGNPASDAFAHAHALVRRGAWQEHEKLVTADPRRMVGRAPRRPEHSCHLAEDIVGDAVAKAEVDELEIVEIYEQGYERP